MFFFCRKWFLLAQNLPCQKFVFFVCFCISLFCVQRVIHIQYMLLTDTWRIFLTLSRICFYCHRLLYHIIMYIYLIYLILMICRAQGKNISCMILLQMAEMGSTLTSQFSPFFHSQTCKRTKELHIVTYTCATMSWIQSTCRFDYIVRDCRACGLGCNFQFQRFFQSSSLPNIHTPLGKTKIRIISNIGFSLPLAGWWRQWAFWVMRYAIVLKNVSVFLGTCSFC